VACAIGDAELAAVLFAELDATQRLDWASWPHLPQVAGTVLAPHLHVGQHDDWDFRWALTALPWQPGEYRVSRLTDADEGAITVLMISAFPASTTRPGDSRINQWYRIQAGKRLVACGADRSRGGVGFLAGITVARDTQGQGLGSALTAAMTRHLLTDHDPGRAGRNGPRSWGRSALRAAGLHRLAPPDVGRAQLIAAAHRAGFLL
jgi:hypothetical protein